MHEIYKITFQGKVYDLLLNTREDCFLDNVDMALYEALSLCPVHHWWKETYNEKFGIYLRNPFSEMDERFIAHIDRDKKLVEIVGDTKNCVAWEDTKYLLPEYMNPQGMYESLLDVLEEDNGLTAIVPHWDVKKIYENERYEVLIDSSNYTYLIDKTI